MREIKKMNCKVALSFVLLTSLRQIFFLLVADPCLEFKLAIYLKIKKSLVGSVVVNAWRKISARVRYK